MNDQNQKPKTDEVTPHSGFGFGASFGFLVSGFGFVSFGVAECATLLDAPVASA
jgi:hypothetical protein